MLTINIMNQDSELKKYYFQPMKVNISRVLFAICCAACGVTACKKSGNFSSSEKTISGVTFKSSDNPGLPSDITAIITSDSVKIEFPYGVDVTNLIPSIVFTGKRITPANRTPQNFTNSVVYTVEAENGTTRSYT